MTRRKEPSIARYEGLKVPGWSGPRPGGGWRGATSGLDDAVQAQAEWLRQLVGDVEIRFNADRQSGGAWLVDPARRNCGVGLTVAHCYDRTTGQHTDELRFAVYLAADLIATDGDRGRNAPDADYGYWVVESLKAARQTLLEHLNAGKGRPWGPMVKWVRP